MNSEQSTIHKYGREVRHNTFFQQSHLPRWRNFVNTVWSSCMSAVAWLNHMWKHHWLHVLVSTDHVISEGDFGNMSHAAHSLVQKEGLKRNFIVTSILAQRYWHFSLYFLCNAWTRRKFPIFIKLEGLTDYAIIYTISCSTMNITCINDEGSEMTAQI